LQLLGLLDRMSDRRAEVGGCARRQVHLLSVHRDRGVGRRRARHRDATASHLGGELLRHARRYVGPLGNVIPVDDQPFRLVPVEGDGKLLALQLLEPEIGSLIPTIRSTPSTGSFIRISVTLLNRPIATPPYDDPRDYGA
jgi:hypothetical protein